MLVSANLIVVERCEQRNEEAVGTPGVWLLSYQNFLTSVGIIGAVVTFSRLFMLHVSLS